MCSGWINPLGKISDLSYSMRIVCDFKDPTPSPSPPRHQSQSPGCSSWSQAGAKSPSFLLMMRGGWFCKASSPLSQHQYICVHRALSPPSRAGCHPWHGDDFPCFHWQKWFSTFGMLLPGYFFFFFLQTCLFLHKVNSLNSLFQQQLFFYNFGF